MRPALSVVIPTHRRAAILSLCLDALEKQSVVDALEVIVVSDGHDNETSALLEHPEWKMSVCFLEIPKSQQGVARNRGVQLAQGTYTLFIGDDILLAPDACERHLLAHAEHPDAAVLGFTTWDPAVGITEVMRWLESSGWQFGYNQIVRHAIVPSDIQHRFTYTSHISLPTATTKQVSFREDVSLYGWEDVEWGMRLKDAGVPLFYEPDAKALHHHHLTLEQSLQRMRILGQSASELAAKIPDFDRVPRGWKLLFLRLTACLPTISGKHRAAFLAGISESI